MTMPLLARMRRWIMDRIVQDVPEAVAACEFDCRKPYCHHSASSPCLLRNRPGRAPVVRTCVVIPFPTTASERVTSRRTRPAMGNASR